jgi:hypothetical protein
MAKPSVMHHFKPLLQQFYELADWTPAAALFVKSNGFDLELINAHAGTIALLPCTLDGDGFFDFDSEGEVCCVFEVLDEDAATPIDLCAFQVAHPNCFGTAIGSAALLGLTNVTNPASWSFGKVMPVYRRPIDWLRADCEGVVILNHRTAPAFLSRKLGNLLAEDETHARDLKSLLCTPPVDPKSILFPKSAARRAA